MLKFSGDDILRELDLVVLLGVFGQDLLDLIDESTSLLVYLCINGLVNKVVGVGYSSDNECQEDHC